MRRFFIDESVKPASLYVVEGDSLVAEAHELERADELQTGVIDARNGVEVVGKLMDIAKAGPEKKRGRKAKYARVNSSKWNGEPLSPTSEVRNGNMTERVKEMHEAGNDDENIARKLGIGVPAVRYHKRKLGLNKVRKENSKTLVTGSNNVPGEVTTAEGTFYEIRDEDDIARIWELVDEGHREPVAIAKLMGRNTLAVKDVLMKPRP